MTQVYDQNIYTHLQSRYRVLGDFLADQLKDFNNTCFFGLLTISLV